MDNPNPSPVSPSVDCSDDGVDKTAEPAVQILVTTDSYEECEQEMSSSLEDRTMRESTTSAISELQDDVANLSLQEENCPQDDTITPDNDLNSSNLEVSTCDSDSNEGDYWHDEEWLGKDKHIFILSTAGKPIYSRYGNEDKLVTLFGVMQALVSFIQIENDLIRSIHAGNMKFVFLVKGPLILVCVSRTSDSVPQIILQLTHVFNQICSVLTLTQLNRIFEQRRNYDLRRLLSGAERLIDHLLTFMETEPAFMLSAVKCLPLHSSVRDAITQIISQSCSKLKNLVFAILIAQNQLITLVRMKKYVMHPADLHLIFNLVNSSESFKTAESWTPICLPKFDASGFLHGHVSYLAEDCQACLLLITVDRDVFFPLSEAKQKIVDKLRRSNCLEPINEAMNKKPYAKFITVIPEVRHFLYKNKLVAQFYSPEYQPPYTNESERKRLHSIYLSINAKLHNPTRPLRVMYQQLQNETVLGWLRKDFEIYVAFEPLVDKRTAIDAMNTLFTGIKKKEDCFFLLNAPTF